MSSVSHREMRNNSAEVLRRVEAGEELVVTNHGRPVARLLPVSHAPLEDLERRGELRRARSGWGSFSPPVPTQGAPTSAELITDLRREW